MKELLNEACILISYKETHNLGVALLWKHFGDDIIKVSYDYTSFNGISNYCVICYSPYLPSNFPELVKEVYGNLNNTSLYCYLPYHILRIEIID